MAQTLPTLDLFGDHANRPGISFTTAQKTVVFAEELNAIWGRIVGGIYTINAFDYYVQGVERISGDGTVLSPKIDLETILTPAIVDGRIWFDGADFFGYVGGVAMSLTGADSSTIPEVATGINYQILSTDLRKVIRTTAGSLTVTLPDPTAVGAGWNVFIKEGADSALSTIARFGSETIDGDASDRSLAKYESVRAWTDGTDWWLI